MSLAQHLHPRIRAHAQALADGFALPPGCTIAMWGDGDLVLIAPKRRRCFIEAGVDPDWDRWAWTYWTGQVNAYGSDLPSAQAAVDAALADMGLAPVAAIPGQLTIDGREVVATVGGTALVPTLFEQQLDLREPA